MYLFPWFSVLIVFICFQGIIPSIFYLFMSYICSVSVRWFVDLLFCLFDYFSFFGMDYSIILYICLFVCVLVSFVYKILLVFVFVFWLITNFISIQSIWFHFILIHFISIQSVSFHFFLIWLTFELLFIWFLHFILNWFWFWFWFCFQHDFHVHFKVISV